MVDIRPDLTSTSQQSRRVLYLGSFLDEPIVIERGLQSHNAAGTNRMKRLAQALRRAGFRPILLSPAISLRAFRKNGPWLYPARVRRRNGIAIIYAPALNLPGLNILAAPFFQLAAMKRILNRPIAGSIIYNFSPGLVLLTTWLALKHRSRIVHNVEDVSVPQLSDWLPRTEARPVQQLIFWLCMHLVARMSDAYLMPTRRFMPYLPQNRSAAIVTGCIDVPEASKDYTLPPLNVLYAGKVEREHGIVQFVEALEKLDRTPVATLIRADISGAGPMSDWVAGRLAKLQRLPATLHGFVPAETYAKLLDRAHVCMVLQDPDGRYANFKTPSKVYEFLGHGKAVLATQVGDIRDISTAALTVLDNLSANEIASRLERLAGSPKEVRAMQKNARDETIAAFSYEIVGQRLAHLMMGRQA